MSEHMHLEKVNARNTSFCHGLKWNREFWFLVLKL